ncbi:hypothetical protein CYMTET_10914 [Cymbomonas tetramitiformis]|uniref:Uncharacterized protein n=1 Tax=Cymbomonas tetramitiformis TaxID=36881 RepID=A0AAE0GNG5_9CHLO|nr:hypothetical protein CYMTET_10914 [Cymbomonas tetramitiformis]
MYSVSGNAYYFRILNAGSTGWRPAVNIQAYSDSGCSQKIAISEILSNSGANGNQGASNAIDQSSSTYWRPNCQPCAAGQVFATFALSSPFSCIFASNLGVGGGGGKSWNGGLTLEYSSDNSNWSLLKTTSDSNKVVFAFPGTYACMYAWQAIIFFCVY